MNVRTGLVSTGKISQVGGAGTWVVTVAVPAKKVMVFLLVKPRSPPPLVHHGNLHTT